LLIDVREVKTRFKLIKHIDTEKNRFRNETEIDDEISLKGSFIHWRNN
jgi:hypothetical protein